MKMLSGPIVSSVTLMLFGVPAFALNFGDHNSEVRKEYKCYPKRKNPRIIDIVIQKENSSTFPELMHIITLATFTCQNCYLSEIKLHVCGKLVNAMAVAKFTYWNVEKKL